MRSFLCLLAFKFVVFSISLLYHLIRWSVIFIHIGRLAILFGLICELFLCLSMSNIVYVVLSNLLVSFILCGLSCTSIHLSEGGQFGEVGERGVEEEGPPGGLLNDRLGLGPHSCDMST